MDLVKNAEKNENSASAGQNSWCYDDKPPCKAISRGVVPSWCGADFFQLAPYAPPLKIPCLTSVMRITGVARHHDHKCAEPVRF